MVDRVKVQNKVIADYIKQSNVPLDSIRKKVNKIDEILDGSLLPTFNQLTQIAKLINVPTGLLALNKSVNIQEKPVNFRTLDSIPLTQMSSELKDTLQEMKDKQDFLRNELDSFCDFVGMFDETNEVEKVTEKIRELLGPMPTKNRFKTYRKRIGELGVFIFVNGKVKDNTHRNLDLSEFRGFVLADNKAPIIFINGKDSESGKLFTLIHEFVHLFFGESNLLNLDSSQSHSRLEAIVNRITGEILVPKVMIRKAYIDEMSLEENVYQLSKKFEVSSLVIARRLLDIGVISKKDYQKIALASRNISPKKTKGGNFYPSLDYRIDQNFFQVVNNAVLQNKITFTDAFYLVGVSHKGYMHLARGVY